MKRFIAALFTVGLGLTMAAPIAGATNDKVTICHRTNSDKNPYVLITVSAKAVDGEGNNDHTHHVVDENHDRADIIPAPFVEADVDGEGDESKIYYCPGGENTGPQGPAGPTGPIGPAGENGTNGTDGPAGIAGKDGANGTNGVDGATGKDGVTTTYLACSDGSVVGLGVKCPVGTEVLGETENKPVAPVGELPHTGFGWAILAVIGAGLGLLGLLLLLLGAAKPRGTQTEG